MKKLAIGMMVVCSLMATSGAALCGDGTVKLGMLVVLQDAGCLGVMDWNQAMARVKTLADGQCDLSDKSTKGDWRLPNIEELKSMYRNKGQFRNVKAYYYWSSSTFGGPANVEVVIMENGFVGADSKVNNGYVWPVRAVK